MYALISSPVARNGLTGLLLLGYTTVVFGAPVVHTQSINPVQQVPAIAGFQTTGADMAGMTVRAFFSDGTEEEVAWTAGGSATGVTHNWSLSVPAAGDTFVAPWTLLYGGGNGLLTGFSIDGFGDVGRSTRATMFDRTLDGLGGLVGTPGSAKGRDLEELAALPFGVHVRYEGAVDATSIPGGPLEDEFRWLNVRFFELAGTPIDEFLTTQPRTVGLDGVNLAAWEFFQDSNNVIVPEPSSAGLAIAALVALLAAIPQYRRRFDQ